jgi:hypothetical protein
VEGERIDSLYSFSMSFAKYFIQLDTWRLVNEWRDSARSAVLNRRIAITD